MPSVQEIVDDLRKLSEKMSRWDVEELHFIETQSHMIGEIYGLYPPYGQEKLDVKRKAKEKEDQKRRKDRKKRGEEKKAVSPDTSPPAEEEMSFEEKRRLYEAKFPNHVSAAKRARARELLNFIANNQSLFTYSTEDLSKAKDAFNMISSKSWKSGQETESAEDTSTKEDKREGREDAGKNGPFSPDVWKFGSHDNLSKMTYDAAFSNTTQSQSTVMAETATPITSCDPEIAASVHTCID